MKLFKMVIAAACLFFLLPRSAGADNGFFLSRQNGAVFSGEVSGLIEKAWDEWQGSIVINGIFVEGSCGRLSPGDVSGPVLGSRDILSRFDRSGKPRYYILAVKAVADAVEHGMRLWQRGYSHDNIPFPRGASCAYTLTPCENVAVTVFSGSSTGDAYMAEKELYNFMLYRVPTYDEDALLMMRAAAAGIADTFGKWKRSCSIVDIRASGGIAPRPAPMGTGPGPVRGARGGGGKLAGGSFDGENMYRVMMDVIEGRRT
ncbi:MAG: hypothetical protein GF392_01150 [Candidatus Omnitrophica bacterium]|nr:hypothetical protein [Candidatus Omnitrophota bacterium]